MKINSKAFQIQDYLNHNFDCNCGKNHKTDIKEILIEEGALKKLPFMIEKYHYKTPFFLFDKNTYQVAGKQIETLLSKNKITFYSYILDYHELVATEAILGEVLLHFHEGSDLFVSVGSGTLNDIGAFLSSKIRIDYAIVGTAPSMDGYASDCSPLIVNNMKVTYQTMVPKIIIGDIEIMKNAPMKMIQAGVGDILGKYTCLVDWKIASLIQDEYYCETIVSMVREAIANIVNNLDKIEKRDPGTIGKIMEGLILSGIAMSFVNNSRPASGSEHHLSHFWEMMFLFQGKKAVLHGTKVGIGTVAVLRMYEMLKTLSIDFEAAKENARVFSIENWEEKIKEVYQSAAVGVIELEDKTNKNKSKELTKRLNMIEKNWSLILKVIEKELPKSEEVFGMLKALGASKTPVEEGISKEIFKNSIYYAKELRNRYGLLQLLFDLGMMKEIGDALVEEYYS